MKLLLIPVDKANHIIYGLLIFSIASLFLNSLFAFIITIVFATAKEIHDYKSYGKFDALDLLATVSLPLIYESFKYLNTIL